MKKSYPHTELSNRTCKHIGCTKRIKRRLVETKKSASLCYKHHCRAEAGRGHTLNSKSRQKRVNAGLAVKTFKGTGV